MPRLSTDDLRRIERTVVSYESNEDPKVLLQATQDALDMVDDESHQHMQRLKELQNQYKAAIKALELRIDEERRAQKQVTELKAQQDGVDAETLKRELASRPFAEAEAVLARRDDLVAKIEKARAGTVLTVENSAAQDVLMLEIYDSLGLSLIKAPARTTSELWEAIGILSGAGLP